MDPLALDDTSVVENFKHVFLGHGILGWRDEKSFEKIKNISEKEKLSLVPYFFYFIPNDLLTPERGNHSLVKPIIRNHFKEIGLTSEDEVLVDIIKRISDHFFRCINETNNRKKAYPIYA